MKATLSGMKSYTTDELISYVSRTQEKYNKAPSFIKRTSYQGWINTKAAIIREIERRNKA